MIAYYKMFVKAGNVSSLTFQSICCIMFPRCNQTRVFPKSVLPWCRSALEGGLDTSAILGTALVDASSLFAALGKTGCE